MNESSADPAAEPAKVEAHSVLRINVPQKSYSHFVSRKVLFRDISDHMDQSPSRIVVLLGLGGSGKTQLALEVCRQSEFGFKIVIWIDASSPVTVKQSYKIIAKKLSRHEGDDNEIERVQDVLQSSRER
ncbi:hypothetical protein MMC25_007336 [Agyrium rufum]|nr:hypothetical protein [Agyrium rufum]